MTQRLSRILLLYLGLSFLFAWDLLWPGRSLYRWDTLLYTWPLVLEAREQILSGHWPFWASSICCGTPLLENINAGVFYPLKIFCYFLPLKLGYQLFLFIHLWLSFVGMHLFLQRGLKLRSWAPFIGALAFGASGYMRSMWDTHNFVAFPWIPLGLAALLEARQNPRRAIVGTTLCWSMMILGGDFQTACLWLPVACSLILFFKERIKLGGALLASVALALLITAPQWVSSYEFSKESYRAEGLTYLDAVERSFNPLRLLELFLPYAFGNRDAWYAIKLAGEGATKLSPWTTSIHLGLLSMFALILSLRKRRNAKWIWAALITVIATLLSFGRFFPAYSAWLALPVVGSFRYPEKYLIWTTFGLATCASFGALALIALFRRAKFDRPRLRLTIIWALLVALSSAIAAYYVINKAPIPENARTWIMLPLFLTGLVVVATLYLSWKRQALGWLAVVFVADLLLAWHIEQPTTKRYEPLTTPIIAQPILQSSSPQGRFLRDRAVTQVPLPFFPEDITGSEKQAVYYRESLTFNSPRLWSMRTADGFSPSESKTMRDLRQKLAAPENDKPTDIEDLKKFCEVASVEWLLTTPEGFQSFSHAEKAAAWGEPEALVLARLSPIQTNDTWRPRAGFIRINVASSTNTLLRVGESYARGWNAVDQNGKTLTTVLCDDAFLGVQLQPDTTQVRLNYAPRHWKLLFTLSAIGLGLLLILFKAMRPTVIACIVFAVLSFAARNHWSCVFDEGFHVARGVVRVGQNDSRLSYFHPPLQNVLCGYFANLAFTGKINYPQTAGWGNADTFPYSVDFAEANALIYSDLVRSSRWGSWLLSLLLIGSCAYWATKRFGATAGWLTGLGLSLNPTILAHGNLTTTDMGVTTFVVLGMIFTWMAFHPHPCPLPFRERIKGEGLYLYGTFAALLFTLAALTKFTGLIWLLTFLLICVPILSVQNKNPRLLFILLLGPVLFGLLLWVLYGSMPQEIRFGPLKGLSCIGGRYFEGIFRQSQHALEGHRGFFNGEVIFQSAWWQLPFAIILKNSMLWILAFVVSATLCIKKICDFRFSICVLPVFVFCILLIAVNNVAIGVRHALPLIVLGILGSSIVLGHDGAWPSKKRSQPLWRDALRRVLILSLITSSIFTAFTTHPHYLSYFPSWAGGIKNGHRWLVDSNYDWGQNLGELEKNWARLTAENNGQPPNLIYYGFTDPTVIYQLNVGPHSYGGFMDWWNHRETLPSRFTTIEGTTVASISALKLSPHGLDFSAVQQGKEKERIGLLFFYSEMP